MAKKRKQRAQFDADKDKVRELSPYESDKVAWKPTVDAHKGEPPQLHEDRVRETMPEINARPAYLKRGTLRRHTDDNLGEI
jgi:hypothetical protein